MPASPNQPPLPRIAITMGDPAGVGPELCLRLLEHAESARFCVPVIFGDAAVLRAVAGATGLPFTAPVLEAGSAAAAGDDWSVLAGAGGPCVLDLRSMEGHAVVPGKLDARCGESAWRCVQAAIDAALAGAVQGVTTGPLNKEALHAAGHRFPGHTEIFAERFGAEKSCMMQYSPEITCSFVTVHCGYAEVPALLTSARILDVIRLTDAALKRIRGQAPNLLVCGLNPHAGEHGLFGDREEERVIIPAVEAAAAEGIRIHGPVPPDTAFTPARRREYDAVICMYHDQGHIPVKMLAFDSAVNTTLGLRVVRTSVDHGTAFDIAWKGEASPGSLYEAVKLAAQLA